MRRRLLSNVGSVVLALLLALIIWFVATYEQNPFVNRNLSGVPIALLNQPPDTVIFDPLETQATLTIRAPQSLVDAATPNLFFVSMDLAAVQPGQPAPVPVIALTDDDRYRIVQVSPTSQPVRLERVQTISATVAVTVTGEPSVGYEAGSATISPTVVLLRGAEPLLGQVQRVVGSLSLDQAQQSVSQQVDLQAVDAQGKPIKGLSITPPSTQIEVPIRQKLGYKPGVSVRADLRIRPAEGYRIGAVELEPHTVTLAGAPATLASMADFVSTQPISLTNATTTLVQRTTLTLPQGVALVGTQFVTVTVEIVPLEGSLTISVPVTYQGLLPTLVAEILPGRVDIILTGPQPLLKQLRPNDVTVVLNLLAVETPGTYRLQPTIVRPEGLKVTNVNPDVVVVRVQRVPPPTPTPTPLPF